MSACVKRLDPSQSLTVIYCDITGLKQVNDTQGHEAGDALILRCCACLREVFDGCGLFRLGGDELLVLCPNISRITADDLVAKLQKTTKAHSVNLAVGMVWLETLSDDLYRSISEAEKRMYEDKAAYYQASGIERRRR